MLIELAIFLLLQQSMPHAASSFSISGVQIGQSYSDLRDDLPDMHCKVSCTDQSALFHGFTGNLWAGIGDSAVNQIAFRFVPELSLTDSETLRAIYIKQYGQPSRTTSYQSCEEWDKSNGSIVLCLKNGLSLTYWKDENFGKTLSVIPDGA